MADLKYLENQIVALQKQIIELQGRSQQEERIVPSISPIDRARGIAQRIIINGETYYITTDGRAFLSAATLSGITSGSIIFAGANGLLSQNNSNFFWNNGTIRQGIGTNSPDTSIHVLRDPAGGTPWIGQIYMEPTSSAKEAGFSIKTTRGSGRIWNVMCGSGGNPTEGFRIYDATAGADRMDINSVGNVGISDTNPSILLSVNGKAGMTEEGGHCIRLTNKTGSNSVKGMIIKASSTTANAYTVNGANSADSIGVVFEAGIADGSEVWVVVGGIADTLIDSGGCALGDRVIAGPTGGYATVSNLPATAAHFQEVGHVLEARAGSGLALVALHFL